MKKNLLFSLIFCCFAITSLFAADFSTFLNKIETLKKQGISYTISSVTNKEKINAKIYMKGEKVRIDTKEGNTIITEKDIYFYSEQEETAAKININKETVKQTTFDIIQDKADELKFIKKSTKNGYSCQVFESAIEGQNAVYYLTDDYGFPTYIKEGTDEINITDFKVGKISDELFILPKNINIIDMSNFSMEDMINSTK